MLYPRGIECLAELMIILQNALYASSVSAVSGGGSCEEAMSGICLNVSQFTLRKFHRFTGLHAIGAVRHGEDISDGQCCDRGNLSSTRRVGMPVSTVWANARSGLVSEFQRCE